MEGAPLDGQFDDAKVTAAVPQQEHGQGQVAGRGTCRSRSEVWAEAWVP